MQQQLKGLAPRRLLFCRGRDSNERALASQSLRRCSKNINKRSSELLWRMQPRERFEIGSRSDRGSEIPGSLPLPFCSVVVFVSFQG